MLKRGNKFLCLLIIGMMMFISIKSVEADTVMVGDRYYYYTTKDGKFGTYASTNSQTSEATRNTIYKELNGVQAFCVQADTYSPKIGEEYTEVGWGENVGGKTWNSTDAIMAGLFMDIIEDNYNPDAFDDELSKAISKYVFKYAGLNSYLAFNKSENYAAYNSDLAFWIEETKRNYAVLAPHNTLPSFGLKADMPIMEVHTSSNGTTYYVGKFSLSNLISSYGGILANYEGGIVNYSINMPNGAKLYNDAKLTSEASLNYSNISGNKTFYVKYTGNEVGKQIQIRVVGSNNSVYPIARLWKPVSTNSQLLVTLGTISYDRLRTQTVTFEVPDISRKTIKVVKKDAGTGEVLSGATLKLQLSGGSNSACTVKDGNYECSIAIDEDLVGDTYYSIVESVAPSGYILGTKVENEKWDIGSSSDICYASTDAGLTVTDMNDCSRNYQINTVCTTDDGVTKEGACEVIVDPSLPEDTPEEEKTYITVGTEEKVCHYIEGENAIKVDESKCSTQFVKVTNSSGNLVVEYFNNKNHVEISKYAVSGDKELVGAELKICSTKPDANGNCTVVRNTLEGQCSTNTSSEGGINLTNEYNCVNNDNGTKVVDMHWISGLTSKIWYGVPKGTYYIVETVAPSGYLPISTYVEFSIDEQGKITSTNYDEESKKIIIENKPTSFKVIKKDSKTGNVLSGAKLSICTAYKDVEGMYQLDVGADGYCVPAVLSNGEAATWESTDKAKVISGLGIGAYYLVEMVAPENYSIADSILFTVNADGTLTDKDGNEILNNELIMHDVMIENVKTAELPIITIVLIGVIAVVICVVIYYYLFKKNSIEIIKNKFKKNN